MTTAAEWGTGEVFLSTLWIVLFVIWFWLLIVVFGDVFRSRDLSGWGKAFWTIFVIVLPYFGVFVYLIARGHKMGEHAAAAAAEQEREVRRYVQDVAGSRNGSTAEELARLAELRDQGALTEAEFHEAKKKTLGPLPTSETPSSSTRTASAE